MNTVQGEIPNYTSDRARQLQNDYSYSVQEQVKKRVGFDSREKWEVMSAP